ncbi:MAG: maleylacetoacetate isomerase [Hyphomonadaceae bacterium]
MKLTLYNYWRSGPSYRVRIGLALKGLAYDYVGVNLLAHEQKSPENRARHPQALVPTLEVDGLRLTQSPAILEWLEETHPSPPLLPAKPADRAIVRGMAGVVACEIHPINNLRVQAYLRAAFSADDAAVSAWQTQWLTEGFAALEALTGQHGGAYCFGDAPTLADIHLIPQIATARRVRFDMAPYPRLSAINERALAHPAFQAAHPDKQPDAAP